MPQTLNSIGQAKVTAIPTTDGGYGTSLPASPTDGMEYTLVDSVSAPTYQWRFRYNVGSSSAYKWEFVGGTTVSKYVATSEGTTSITYVDLATVQSFVLPRAGDYLIRFGVGYAYTNGSAGLTNYIELVFSGAASGDFIGNNAIGSNYYFSFGMVEKIYTAQPASTDVRLRFASGNVANTLTVARRTLSITPVRVS